MATEPAAPEPAAPDPAPPCRMRFRLFVDGKQICETWIDVDDPQAHAKMRELRETHLAAVDSAASASVPWLIEVYDPGVDEDMAYLRFGTDRAAMVQPMELEPGELTALGGAWATAHTTGR